MIARVPNANALPLVLSAKLGLVAVPDTDLLSLAHGNNREPNPETDREGAFDRNAVRGLLQVLGANLGLALLSRKQAGFPDEADAAEGEAAVPDSASLPPAGVFPDAAVRRSLESLDAVWMRDGEVIA